MRAERQPAYVLHVRAYRETSLLLECLTRDHGRIGVVARGVRGPRARIPRAELEPFQPLELDLAGHGELATLARVELPEAALAPKGNAALAGLYVNELVVRLSVRDDPSPGLFAAYDRALRRLAAGGPLSWTLRRFERDLMAAIGYALALDQDTEGRPIDAAGSYAYAPGTGATPCPAGAAGALRGSDLLALAADEMPDRQGLVALRNLMRRVIRFHLGGRDLASWQVLAMAASSR